MQKSNGSIFTRDLSDIRKVRILIISSSPIFSLYYLLTMRNMSQNLLEKIAPFLNDYNDKDVEKYISIKIHTFTKMYNALKIGWNDIAFLYPNHTHENVFIMLLMAYYMDKLVRPYNLNEFKYWTYLPKLIVIKKFPEFMKKHLVFLSRSKDLDETSREFYNSILEGYNRDPYGRGLDKAIEAFKEIAKKDIYVAGELKEYYKALSIFGAYSDLTFDDFLQSSNPGYSFHHKDIELTKYAILYQASQIKEVLLQSPNPRVRKAVSEWLGVSEEIIAFQRTLYQRNAVRKKTLIDKNI